MNKDDAVEAVASLQRKWFCYGKDCSPFDHGRDEGLQMALDAVKAVASRQTETDALAAELKDAFPDGAISGVRRILTALSKTRVDALEEAAREACDLLAERKTGPAARSPAHNARIVLERALKGADHA